MMSTDKVARIISQLHGLPYAKAQQIANAVAHRRRAATECSDLSPSESAPPPMDVAEALRIPVDALAREISVRSTIPLDDALSIATRVMVRVSLYREDV